MKKKRVKLTIFEIKLLSMLLECRFYLIDEWQKFAPEKTFDVFLIECCKSDLLSDDKKAKKVFHSFRVLIPKLIDIWQKNYSEITFENYLDDVSIRHDQIIKKTKKEVKQ